MASGDRDREREQENRKTDPETVPAGIAHAALEGARASEQSVGEPAPDAKTVAPDRAADVTGQQPAARRTENDEAPLGGAAVAFPAPSAQPSKSK